MTDNHPFLQPSAVIDWTHPAVLARAQTLRGTAESVDAVITRCFEWVRDEIKHSGDFGLTEVTCRASDVLLEGSAGGWVERHAESRMGRAPGGAPRFICHRSRELTGGLEAQGT